jgi:hypothetical protein
LDAAVITTDAPPGTEPLPWDDVRERPVLAVWLADKVYSTTSPGARKGRNLEHWPECSLAARAPAIDIVIEGVTSWVDDRGLLEQIAAAYDSKYGWPVSITNDNMFEAPYGAPTAGPPPYRSAALSAPWRTPDASYWQQG